MRRAAAGAHRLRCVVGSRALFRQCAPRRRALHPRPPHLRRGVGARRGCVLRPEAAAPRPLAPARVLFVPRAIWILSCAVHRQTGILAPLAQGRGVIAVSLGRALWLRCAPAARPDGARLRARRAPVANESAARRDDQRRQLSPTSPQVSTASIGFLPVNGYFSPFQISLHQITDVLRYGHLARSRASSDRRYDVRCNPYVQLFRASCGGKSAALAALSIMIFPADYTHLQVYSDHLIPPFIYRKSRITRKIRLFVSLCPPRKPHFEHMLILSW